MGIVRGLLEKRDGAHPSAKLSWASLFGSNGTSYTGINVTEDSALSSTAVFNGIKILAETTSSLPLHLYRRSGRGKDRYTAHPLYIKMHLKPNPEMTSMNFRESQMVQNIMWGDCYSEIEREESGRVLNLWPLLSKNTTMKRVNGELVYFYRLPDGSEKILSRFNVLHIPGFGATGINGLNPILRCKEAIGLSLALEQYGATFFGNGANPDGVLMHPMELSEKAKDSLRKEWDNRHQGLSKSHRMAVIEEGMKYERIGVTPEESQAIEARKFQVVEVARILNMPVHMLKDLDRASFNNIEHMSLEFVTYTLRPWLVRFEQNYTVQLLSDKEQAKYFFEFLVDGLLRGDVQTRFSAYTSGIQNGIYSPNDVREMENRNPYEGGDVYVMQLNMVPVDLLGEVQTGSEPEPEEPPEGDESSVRSIEYHEHDITEVRDAKIVKGLSQIATRYHRLLINTYQQIVSKETIAIKRMAKKQFEERGVSGFNTWVGEFYAQHSEYVTEKLRPILRTYQELIAREAGSFIGIDLEEIGYGELEKFFNDTIEASVKRYVGSSSGQLSKIIADMPPDEVLAAILERMDSWYAKRAKKLAEDESVRFMNATARETWIRNGVKKIKWRTVGTSCPFCNMLNGRTVGREESFLDAGDVIYASKDWADIYNPATGYKEKNSPNVIPEGTKVTALKTYSKKMHPPIHRGCDCILMPEIRGII